MTLISFDAAVEIVLKTAPAPKATEERNLMAAVGYASSCDVVATIPNPRFDNSAVDGYVLVAEDDASDGRELTVVGEAAAGGSLDVALKPGECARVFTGAPVPPNAYAIAMQEDVHRDAGKATLTIHIQPHANIRRAGTDIAEGELLVSNGDPITAECVALFASQGILRANVYRAPKVAVVSTGNELRKPGEQLGPSDIYESNGPMLRALLLRRLGVDATVEHARDDATEIENAIAKASRQNDVVIVTGGASVGDHDCVPGAMSRLGETLFHGVAMRPGKPVLFGRVESALVFGLPGNPASSFVGFHLFALTAIRRMSGWARPETRWLPLRFGGSAGSYSRDDFVRCQTGADGIARPVGHQGSFGLRSLAAADCLVRLPANQSTNDGDVRDATSLA